MNGVHGNTFASFHRHSSWISSGSSDDVFCCDEDDHRLVFKFPVVVGCTNSFAACESKGQGAD